VTAADDLIERIRTRLLPTPQGAETIAALTPDWMPEGGFNGPPRDAAVLVAIVRRGELLSVLYTERSPDLRSHSGQIAFPGGKLDPEDDGPAAGALREANEEAGVPPELVTVLGRSTLDYGYWSYTTVLARAARFFEPVIGDAESVSLRWVPFDRVEELPLHPGVAVGWPGWRAELAELDAELAEAIRA